ncbi:MAG: hypothetical protein SFV81_30020 [Pirellulaceae bacterium]|nr:hypothetical protein [Pirellulaceae bacterium]
MPSSQVLFFAKTWYHGVLAAVSSHLAAMCTIMGPLFLFGFMKKADGTSGVDAGIALCALATPMILLALLGWSNVLVRRKPLLRIDDEGIEVNLIGRSSLDGVPLIPPVIRVMWLVVSLQGFKQQLGWIPWEMYRGVQIGGMPMVRTLFIDATIAFESSTGADMQLRLVDGTAFVDADFQVPLEKVAATIQAFYDEFESRRAFPGLNSK